MFGIQETQAKVLEAIEKIEISIENWKEALVVAGRLETSNLNENSKALLSKCKEFSRNNFNSWSTVLQVMTSQDGSKGNEQQLSSGIDSIFKSLKDDAKVNVG